MMQRIKSFFHLIGIFLLIKFSKQANSNNTTSTSNKIERKVILERAYPLYTKFSCKKLFNEYQPK